MVHLVQTGTMGQVGRFRAADRRGRPRGCPVICRTDRGLETGVVLATVRGAQGETTGRHGCDGELLRKMTPEDRLIQQRIERFADQAFAACTRVIEDKQLPDVLVDVEHLFDGENIFFWFLGEVSPRLADMMDELAETWETRVRLRQFSRRLAEGCGPDCGTSSGGCGDNGCHSCPARGRCGSPG